MVGGKLISAILMTLAASRSLAQQLRHGNGERLGTVHFALSCNGVAQKEFNRAVGLLHSFPFSRLERARSYLIAPARTSTALLSLLATIPEPPL
jgi:hypothetical protein